MDTLSFKTISVNKATAQKEWVVVDATDQVMGRFCSKVAKLLRGKYKPSFTPNVDCGDNVIIINADKITMTGNKWTEREWLTFTGYPSGQRAHTAAFKISFCYHIYCKNLPFLFLNFDKYLVLYLYPFLLFHMIFHIPFFLFYPFLFPYNHLFLYLFYL